MGSDAGQFRTLDPTTTVHSKPTENSSPNPPDAKLLETFRHEIFHGVPKHQWATNGVLLMTVVCLMKLQLVLARQ
jgi:hypothetical protein